MKSGFICEELMMLHHVTTVAQCGSAGGFLTSLQNLEGREINWDVLEARRTFLSEEEENEGLLNLSTPKIIEACGNSLKV